MNKLKKLLTMSLTVLYCSSLVPVHALGTNEGNSNETATITVDGMNLKEYNESLGEEGFKLATDQSALTRETGNTGAGDFVIPGIMIPNVTIDGKLAYCVNLPKDFPVNLHYTKGAEYTNNAINAILYHGYPKNASNLKGKHGVSDIQARRYTQFAIWAILEPNSSFTNLGVRPSSIDNAKKIPYVAELLRIANSNQGAPNNFNMTTTTPNFKEENKLQVSEVIHTSGSNGTFTFPSDDNVYSVDTNGNKKSSFKIGDSFKVIAKGSVKGNITKQIQVSIPKPINQLFNPSLSNYQTLVVPDYGSGAYNSTKNLTFSFNGVIERGNIEVKKVDENGSPLSSVTFGLFSDSAAKNQITTSTTNANGIATFTNLEAGKTYYVKETSGLQGYVVDSSVKTVVLNSNSANITVTNTKIVGQIEIIKKETGNDSSRLEGAEFAVLNSNNQEVDKLTTGKDGRAVSKKLPYGTYTVKETKAPHGYILSNETKTINIDTLNKTYSVAFNNDKASGQIEIIKKETGNDSSRLEGAEFAIFNSNNQEVDRLTTGKDGRAVSKKLPYGDYMIKETKAPNGYLLSNEVKSVLIDTLNKTYSVTFNNDKIVGQIEVIKREAGIESSRLEGAEFTIFNSNNQEVQKLTTGKDGRAVSINLDFGTYTIKETKAPNGYLLSDKTETIKVDSSKKVYSVVFDNELMKGSIEINKIDGDTKKPLAGVKFGIYNSSNELVQEVVSNENGIATSNALKLGTYYVQELEALEGYNLDDTRYQILVNEHNKVFKQEIKNSKSSGKIIIKKVDAEDKTPISDVMFEITATSGLNKGLVKFDKTNADGIVEFDNLLVGEYEIKELEAATGYILDESIQTVKIKKDGDVIEVVVENKRIKGQFEVIKYDASSEEKTLLEGVTFKVRGISDLAKNVEPFEFTTDDKGSYISEMLPYGKYEIVETIAKDGYILDSTPIVVDIVANETIVTEHVGNDVIQGVLEFLKVDQDGKPLAGAKMLITGVGELNSHISYPITSSEEVERITLPYGPYEIREIEAPTGYITSEEVKTFEIKENSEEVTVEFTNTQIKADVVITKVSSRDKKLTLEGAEFELYNENKELIDTKVTDENGVITFEGLPYGTYFYKETKAPNGYVLDTNFYEFKVENTDTIEITVTNKPMIKPLPDISDEETPKEEVILPALPDTSGVSPIVISVISLMLLSVGGVIIFKKRK